MGEGKEKIDVPDDVFPLELLEEQRKRGDLFHLPASDADEEELKTRQVQTAYAWANACEAYFQVHLALQEKDATLTVQRAEAALNLLQSMERDTVLSVLTFGIQQFIELRFMAMNMERHMRACPFVEDCPPDCPTCS